MFPNDSMIDGEFTLEDARGSEVPESSFNVLVLADFSGVRETERVWPGRAIDVDRDNFGEVMRKMVPRVTVDLPDAPLEIGFGDIEAFHPDSLFNQVGLFDELRALRRGLKSNTDYDLAARRVRSWIGPSAVVNEVSNVPESGGDLLDSILGSESGMKRESALDAFVAEVLEPHVVRIDDDERTTLIDAVDRASATLMRTIIHAHGFRAMESIWRGLHFLVRRFETDAQHRVFLLDVSKNALLKDLRSGDLSESAFVKTFSGIENVGMVVAGFDFSVDVDDIAALIRLSRVGAAFDAPIVSFLNGGFGINPVFSESDEKLWKALRDSDCAEFVGLTPNRILGRTSYGARTEPIETFDFEEFESSPESSDLCWLNPGFAIGLLSVMSHRSGVIMNQINKLPWMSYDLDGESRSVNCAEFDVNEKELGLLLDAGLMPIVGFRNEDRIVVPRFQSVSSKGRTLGGRR